MDKLAESFVALIVDKHCLHPNPPTDLSSVLKTCYMHSSRQAIPGRSMMFHQEFSHALRNDEEYQRERFSTAS